MSRRLIWLFVATLVLAPASAEAKPRAGCAPKGSKAVNGNRLARLYVKRDREGDRVLYGCWKATGRKLRLASEFDDDYVTSGAFRDVLLAGRFAAFVYDSTDISCKAACPPGYDSTTTRVTVRDLRTRRGRSTPADVTPRTLRLSTRGVAAWLSPGANGGHELRVIDGAGLGRVIDSGRIDPDFVKLRGLRLEWVGTLGVSTAVNLTPF